MDTVSKSKEYEAKQKQVCSLNSWNFQCRIEDFHKITMLVIKLWGLECVCRVCVIVLVTSLVYDRIPKRKQLKERRVYLSF